MGEEWQVDRQTGERNAPDDEQCASHLYKHRPAAYKPQDKRGQELGGKPRLKRRGESGEGRRSRTTRKERQGRKRSYIVSDEERAVCVERKEETGRLKPQLLQQKTKYSQH